MSGKRHRDKGNRVERALVHAHQEVGIGAERVPLSGAAGGSYSGDLIVTPPRGMFYRRDRFLGEVKARKAGAGFKTLERWLGENDLLFLVRDRQDPLVVVSWSTYLGLMGGTYEHDSGVPAAPGDGVGGG
jgi:hypothetical protein